MRDVKELIGILMRVRNGEEITEDDVRDLDFDAEGELLTALNETFIDLMAFVHDRDKRRANAAFDRERRQALQASLDRIVALCDGKGP